MTEKIQDQMPGLSTENEVVVRGHVRRVKPAGERKPRAKKYPSKWGRGKTYGFSDARVLVALDGVHWMYRLKLALLVLLGGTVRHDGPLVVIAAQGTKPVVKPVSDDLSTWRDAEYLLGPREVKP